MVRETSGGQDASAFGKSRYRFQHRGPRSGKR